MIKLLVEGYISIFIDKCKKNNINLYNITYLSDNKIYIKVSLKDYKLLKDINIYSDIKIINYYGLYKFINIIKKFYYDIFLLIISILIMYITSNIVLNIKIYTSNKKDSEAIKNELKQRNIKLYTFIKNNYNDISNDIMNYNKDIEFISIIRNGTNIEVRFNKNITSNNTNNHTYCNIISNNDAVITRIEPIKGDPLVIKNNIVKKGDILINGSIMFNEEEKEKVCAEGKVFGIVWYKIKISIPKTKEVSEYTKKKKYNISFNNKLLFKNKLSNYDEFIIFNIGKFKIIKYKEKIIKTITLTKEEVVNEAINEANKRLFDKIDKNSTIIDQKVLKVNEFNSKIDIELFISVEQLISNQMIIE